MGLASDTGLHDNGVTGAAKIIIFPAHISAGYMRPGAGDLTSSDWRWLYARHNVEPEYQSADPNGLLPGLLSVLQIRQRGSVLSCSSVSKTESRIRITKAARRKVGRPFSFRASRSALKRPMEPDKLKQTRDRK